MNHRVQAAADYKPSESKEADHTVLLKLKEGDEYKLVLNMQVIHTYYLNVIVGTQHYIKPCFLQRLKHFQISFILELLP